MAGRLFTYVITHDGGFAPNPFYGTLTLNCCKPDIRRHAQVGDWVAAFTAADFPAGRGLLVYAMRVSQKMTMVEYDAWTHNHLPEKIPPQGGGLARHERQAGDSQYNFDTDHRSSEMASTAQARRPPTCQAATRSCQASITTSAAGR
jgi:hypothetical protein